MKFISYLTIIPFLALSVQASSPVKEAERLLRNGDAAGALRCLKPGQGPDSDFWIGRALIELNRMKEAAEHLGNVPESHPLYPYAAKALLYCAWQSPEVDFSTVVPKLAVSNNSEVAKLAAAALAEFWLQQPESQDNSALSLLRDIARQHPEFTPTLNLLEVENLRQKGRFDAAIELCRKLEENPVLTEELRHRVRLALAEVYYAREAKTSPDEEQDTGSGILSTITQTASAKGESEDEDMVNPLTKGRGEETLLHFISTNPESTLLKEAFRRLAFHRAFSNGEQARAKLREWIEDVQWPRRASLALLIQQHLLAEDNPKSETPDNTCANLALSLFPNEAATQIILLEQTRILLESGLMEDAEHYLRQVRDGSPYKTFYTAYILAATDVNRAAELFRECARTAPAALRPAAAANSLLCALKSGNTELEGRIMNFPYFTPEEQMELYAARFLYFMEKDSAKAREAKEKMQHLLTNSSHFLGDFELDKAWFGLQESPSVVADLLINSDISKYTPKQKLRYYILKETAIRRAAPVDRKAETEERICSIFREAMEHAKNTQLRHPLGFHLAHLLSSRGIHEEAFTLLMQLHGEATTSHFAAMCMFHAAREKELADTKATLAEAENLYKLCAEKYTDFQAEACIRRATVLIRMGRSDEAVQQLKALLSGKTPLTPTEHTLALLTMANKFAMDGTMQDLEHAENIALQALQTENLPRHCKFTVLLCHAALCLRSEKQQDALVSYRRILEMKPATGAFQTDDAEWQVFHRAASGSIAVLAEMGRFKEAADTADEMSRWNAAHTEKNREHQRYAAWAEYIRQTYFVK